MMACLQHSDGCRQAGCKQACTHLMQSNNVKTADNIEAMALLDDMLMMVIFEHAVPMKLELECCMQCW
jgi:hypothetical protein